MLIKKLFYKKSMISECPFFTEVAIIKIVRYKIMKVI